MPIRTDRQGVVGIVTIDRPDVMNAMDPSTMVALRDVLVGMQDDTAVRSIVLTGGGGRAFSTGADLKNTFPGEHSFASGYFGPAREAVERGFYLRPLDIAALRLRIPVVAAIDGYAIGGGLELALACDLRVCSDRSWFGLPEVKVGSCPAVGGVHRLLRAVPEAVAMYMLFTGEMISAEAALRWGLVSHVFPADVVLEEATRLATRIAENAPLAVTAVKELARLGAGLSAEQATAFEQLTWGALRDTKDRLEGRRAFAERRAPIFDGR
jgi:E-phenylitaconyl-CoA hydratase